MGAIAVWAAKNKKVVIWGGVIIVIIVLLIVFKDKLKSMFTHNEESDLVNKAKKEVNIKNISKSPVEIEGLVSRLFAAMDGLGTNFDAVKDVIKSLQNRDEWYSVVSIFGLRAESDSVYFKNTSKRSLVAWLEDELNSAEMSEIKGYLNKIDVHDLGA